ncbi:hypothetical protein D3C72_1371180 [compost metagenome]
MIAGNLQASRDQRRPQFRLGPQPLQRLGQLGAIARVLQDQRVFARRQVLRKAAVGGRTDHHRQAVRHRFQRRHAVAVIQRGMRVNIRRAEVWGNVRRRVDQRDAVRHAVRRADPVARGLVSAHDQQLVMGGQLRQGIQQRGQPFAQRVASHQQAADCASIPSQAGTDRITPCGHVGRRQFDPRRDDIHLQFRAIAAMQLVHDQARHGHDAPGGRTPHSKFFQQQIGCQARTQPRIDAL